MKGQDSMFPLKICQLYGNVSQWELPRWLYLVESQDTSLKRKSLLKKNNLGMCVCVNSQGKRSHEFKRQQGEEVSWEGLFVRNGKSNE